jgi:hypothetical protein
MSAVIPETLTLVDCGIFGEKLICRTCGEDHYPNRMRDSVLVAGIVKGVCAECWCPIGEDVHFHAVATGPGCDGVVDRFEDFADARYALLEKLTLAWSYADGAGDDLVFDQVIDDLQDSLRPASVSVSGRSGQVWTFETYLCMEVHADA